MKIVRSTKIKMITKLHPITKKKILQKFLVLVIPEEEKS
jgi:hypothetical protein